MSKNKNIQLPNWTWWQFGLFIAIIIIAFKINISLSELTELVRLIKK
ncbi:MAG: hypothetical protein P8K68_10130 [Algibacter sp.]|nr:hypothetical protein [Algibacter sp.]MDG1729716.1 hypothetical protein [Algibacter sp.]MDG2179127.1 hypothetical protein [Algibacter sp.]